MAHKGGKILLKPNKTFNIKFKYTFTCHYDSIKNMASNLWKNCKIFFLLDYKNYHKQNKLNLL